MYSCAVTHEESSSQYKLKPPFFAFFHFSILDSCGFDDRIWKSTVFTVHGMKRDVSSASGTISESGLTSWPLSVHCQGDFHHSQPIHALSTELCKIEILYPWQEFHCAYVLSVHISVPRGMYARDFGVGENEPGAIWLKYWRLIRQKPLLDRHWHHVDWRK